MKMTVEQQRKYGAAYEELVNLLDEHDPEVTFSRHLFLNRRKRCLGLCRYPFRDERGKIFISQYLLDEPLGSIIETVRHEVAHMIAGVAAGHGPDWRAAARLVGAKPERCGPAMESALAAVPYSIECPDCGSLGSRCKLTKALRRKVASGRCAKCMRSDIFLTKFGKKISLGVEFDR